VRDEVVAAIALGYFHHVTAVAELVYVFLQNHFHVSNSVSNLFWLLAVVDW
jgi:hypothetical protein